MPGLLIPLHPDATLRYIASDMYLWVHSDASYLSEPKARTVTFPSVPPKPNGAVHVVTHLMKEIVGTTLMELGFPQDATPIQTDNSTACGIANETVKERR
jgi:hypothetical protein